MGNHVIPVGYGCCVVCGFVVDNKEILIAVHIVIVVIWIAVLVHIIYNCRRRNKASKLIHERRKRRGPADTTGIHN